MTLQEPKQTKFKKSHINAAIRYIILIFIGIILIYPILWMFGASFMENADIFGSVGILPPFDRVVWDHFPSAWQLSTHNTILFYYANTLRFLIPRVIFTIISCTITAYAISRFNFPGKRIVFTIVIVTLLMPEVAFRIPVYVLMRDLGLLNTFASLYVQDMFAVNSFFVFMIIQFMRTIPRELDEAASIDGCNALQTLWFILVPVLRPIIISVGLFTFMWGMNDYLGPLIYLTGAETRPLSLALAALVDFDVLVPFGRVFAAATLALLPTIGIFFACSRYFVESVTSSGGKE
ncbi:MAG: carbohydrate ABC transporter permease [Clostridiales bacterium]|jgi:oligogalacturonide transport system permease protein|nr:carbohydrate ABC transporter permease [Clostridiales bacterium]